MKMPALRSDAQVRSINFATSSAAAVYTDSAIGALKLYVGRSTKTFRLVKMVRGKSYDETLGHSPTMSLTEARAAAAVMLQDIATGKLGRAEVAASRLTVADAYEIACETHKRKATAAYYATMWKKYVGPKWGKWRLIDLAGEYEAVRQWHLELTAKHSNSVADGAIKTLDMLFKRARSRHPSLPKAPTQTVARHGDRVAEYDLSRKSLAAHFAAVAAEPNPVKRAINDFLYLTGMRIGAVRSMQWDWLSEDGIDVPGEYMKTGKDFFCPVTPPVREVLDRARRYGNGSAFVFPSLSTGGRIGPYAIPGAWTNRALRKHFATQAHLTVHPILAETLMAHELAGISASIAVYVKPTREALVEAAGIVHAHLAAIEGYR